MQIIFNNIINFRYHDIQNETKIGIFIHILLLMVQFLDYLLIYNSYYDNH